jgi:hypothetical protein
MISVQSSRSLEETSSSQLVYEAVLDFISAISRNEGKYGRSLVGVLGLWGRPTAKAGIREQDRIAHNKVGFKLDSLHVDAWRGVVA